MARGHLAALPGLALLLASCGAAADETTTAAPAAPARSVAPPEPAAPEATAEATTEESEPESDAEAPAPEPPTPDELAGLRSDAVPERGSGATVVVPGEQPAPGDGDERRVRVEVEGGLDVDGAAFAEFVLDTLNEPRSWSADGLTFSRTDGDADVVVVLASPQTSEQMCQPLVTRGTLSCRKGPNAIITMHRWVNGMEDYGQDLTGYRHYVINHEVGHVLGHRHQACPAPGDLAPVMQQQTKDVDPCLPNPWPYP